MVTLTLGYKVTPYQSSIGLHFDGWLSDTPDAIDGRVAAINTLSDGFVHSVSASEKIEDIDVSVLTNNGPPSEDDGRRFTLLSASGNRLKLHGPIPNDIGTQPALVDKNGYGIVFSQIVYG